MKNKVTAG